MLATLKYGIGQEMLVPVSKDTVARLSKGSVQEAIEDLLKGPGPDPDGTRPAIQKAVTDPQSVIEVKTPGGYQPVEHKASAGAMFKDREAVEVLVSRPHAGG